MTTKSWVDCYDVPGADLFAKTESFAGVLEEMKKGGQHFFRRAMLSASRNRVLVRDPATGRKKEMLQFGSNSYLGLGADPRVIRASMEATLRYGYGTGAVSLYAGTTDLHIELERRIARFYGREDAILFPTGYAANVGVVSALVRERDAVVNDLFNHASIYDGCKLSGAKTYTFAHRRARHLERVLKRATGPDHATLVITDGVFSMDGDVAPLDEMLEVAARYGARVMVDEAHALGVVGRTGRGTEELFGVEGKVDVLIGTLSKAPSGIGGYVTGSKKLIDYLRYYARPYFFSTSMPAPVVAGLIEVFKIMEGEPERHRRLWRNIRYVTARLRSIGFDLGDTRSAIVPVMVNDEEKLGGMLMDLHEADVFMNYVAYPAVPRRKCRLRMNVMSEHTREELDYVVEVLERLGRKYGVIGDGGEESSCHRSDGLPGRRVRA
ncbi:MAG: aminotransferase class I/II-fold pyridoxal phosphate-dependent enzyme [Planctomycetota bacterium]|jgi:glycine C-acetyltransferase